jgi:diphthine-ammonia ligase
VFQEQCPGLEAVATGAILSDYQRLRVENVYAVIVGWTQICSYSFVICSCTRLGLISLSYLWRRDQSELLQEMVDSRMVAVLIKVAALGL